MPYTVNENDVESWVMLYLYREPQKLDNMVEYGCKRMVYGRSLNDLRSTLNTLIEKKFIDYDSRYDHYFITTDGKWQIRNTVLLPLFTLTPDSISLLIEELHHESDIRFLSGLRDHYPDESTIQDHVLLWAKANATDIFITLSEAITLGLINNPQL